MDQNLILIYYKSNDNFKNHINFRRIKEWYIALPKTQYQLASSMCESCGRVVAEKNYDDKLRTCFYHCDGYIFMQYSVQ